MKFQPATSIKPSVLWCSIGVVVLLAGEAARTSAWPFLTVAAAAAMTLTVVARLQPGAGERAQAIGLAAVAATLIIAAVLIGHTRFHAANLQDEAVAAAMARRERILASSIAAAKHTAFLALDRVGDRTPTVAPDLSDLVSNGEIESAIAVIAGDTILDVAGAQRMTPEASAAPAALVSTPFARLLVVRETRARRQAQVVLLLDSLPGLPVAGPSLADVSGDGVLWRWTTPDNGIIEYRSTDAAVAGINAAMRPVPAPFDTFLVGTARTARLLVAAGLMIAAIVTLLTSVYPLVRAAAVVLPLSALSRSGVGTVLFGPNAVRTVLVATALLFLAIELWRRPARRTAVGMAAALLLLATAPPLVVLLARALVPHGEELPLLPGFGWEMIVALATGALLAVAMAPLRAPGDDDASSRWGVAAAIASVIVGLIGIEAWSPGTPPVPGAWAGWYPPLWLVPVVLLLPLTRPRVRLVALATAAGVLASLATWATTVDRRIELAAADLARLTAPVDSTTLAALDQFAVAARANHATRLDRLYATWGASQLAAEGVPTYLSLWSAEGHQREFVALDSLRVSWDELAPLVRQASAEPRHFGLSGRVGHHEVLILPLAPDTIATVTVGPRSRLLVPTTFGLLVGWRSWSNMPPFSDSVVTTGAAGSRPDGQFRRSRRHISADVIVHASDPPRVVRAMVDLLPPAPFLVRGALAVLLDVGLILAVWLLLQRVLGDGPRAATDVFRRSYRRTVATVLMAFFIVPTVAFTLVSVLRLRLEARRGHEAEVAGVLRTVKDVGGMALADSAAPSNDRLAFIADSANAEVGIYRQGRLVAASDSMLAELGLMPPVVRASAGRGADAGVITSGLNGAALRIGAAAATRPGTALLVVVPGGDTGLASEQFDQLLVLLLATLAGIAASILGAGIIARTLGRPIDTLRRTAIAIGRHETPPRATDVPAEFVPVFGAINQMEHDLRTTEAELQAGRTRTAAILSTVATGVIGIDASGDVIHVNPRAAELLGHDIQLGQPLPPQLVGGWERVGDGIERLLGRHTRTPENREVQVGERRMAITLAPLGDGGLVLAITDITEASRAARVLAWGEMARQVAHEIKNPLTPMRLGLQHLRRVRADESPDLPRLVDETTERLLIEIERLDRIARSFARYGAPPERAAPLEPIDVRAVADEMASLFALGAERMQIEVVGSAGGPVRARREELVQVLLNLLENARQADAAAVRIVLEGYTLRLEDNGRGIPPEQVGRIFEPSFSTTTSGTGLGLAIVRRLVEGWGATIGVQSEPGAGAAFTIRFAAA